MRQEDTLWFTSLITKTVGKHFSENLFRVLCPSHDHRIRCVALVWDFAGAPRDCPCTQCRRAHATDGVVCGDRSAVASLGLKMYGLLLGTLFIYKIYRVRDEYFVQALARTLRCCTFAICSFIRVCAGCALGRASCPDLFQQRPLLQLFFRGSSREYMYWTMPRSLLYAGSC